MSKAKMIIFEEIFPSHEYVMKWYLLNGYEIYFIRLNRASKDKKWLKVLIGQGRIKKIVFNFRLNTYDGFYFDLAFDNINHFYKSYIDDNGLFQKNSGLYRNNNIALVFKKTYTEELARFYYLNFVLNHIQTGCPDKKIWFVPSHGLRSFYKTDTCEIYDYFKFYKQLKSIDADCLDNSHLSFPLWAIFLSYLNANIRKGKILLQILGVFVWGSLMSVRTFLKGSAANGSLLKPSFKYAVMVLSAVRQFSNAIQKIDFLIDGELIKKEEVLFISCNKLKEKHKSYMEEEKLNYLDSMNKFISWKEVKNALPLLVAIFKSFFKENWLILDTCIKDIYLYLRWESIAANITIKRLVSCADFGIQSIVRNIILEQHGCETYYYMDSANFGFNRVTINQDKGYHHKRLGFLYYDYFIAWNDFVPGCFKVTHCIIKHYLNLGCLWAEHLRLIEEGKIKSYLPGNLYNHGYRAGMKLISVFDSGLHDDLFTTYEDGIKFLEGILRLLNDLPNVFIIFKEKHPRGHHRKVSDRFIDIVDLYSKIEQHPRCYCIKNYWENSSVVMAFNNLTISFPFTSTTFEALAAGKKAIWYDATAKFRETFYATVPGLVLHNYDELINRVKHLLSMSDKEYLLYLDTYIKGKVEDYLDGKAITRFRKQLAGDGIYSKSQKGNYDNTRQGGVVKVAR